MSAFFDTIIPEIVADQLTDEGVNSQVVHFILSLFEEIYAQMETASGTSRPTKIYPGFRQGCRFSTTAGKIIVRRIMNLIRPRCKGIEWGRMENMKDIEFADDITLFANTKKK